MSTSPLRTLASALVAILLLATSVTATTAADLQADLVASEDGLQHTRDLGSGLVGGQTGSFTVRLFVVGDDVEFPVYFAQASGPGWVSYAGGGSIWDPWPIGVEFSRIGYTVPCALGPFSGRVEYAGRAASGSVGVAEAWLDIEGSVGEAGPDCDTGAPPDTRDPVVRCEVPDADPWYAGNVSVPCTASDADSGLAHASDASFTLSTAVGSGSESDRAQTHTRDVCDRAEPLPHCVQAGPYTFKVDMRVPRSVAGGPSRDPDLGSWYAEPLDVVFTGLDLGSGIDACTERRYDGPDGAGLTVAGSCTDRVGNTSPERASATFDFDATPPSVTVRPDRDPDHAGWYSAPLTFSTRGSDATSGIGSCTGDQVYAGPDGEGLRVDGSCTDRAGNAATDRGPAFRLDDTDPRLAWVDGIADGSDFVFGSLPGAPSCTASDEGSGPEVCSVEGWSAAVGEHTLRAVARDVAGNRTRQERSYRVLPWSLLGFAGPVEMGGVLNSVKGGSVVQLRFQVFAGDTELTDVVVVDSLAAREVACGRDDPGARVPIVTTGGGELRYDETAGRFTMSWKTPRTPGQCLAVQLTTDDGSSLEAIFELR